MLNGLDNLRVFEDAESLGRAAAEQVLRIAGHHLDASQRFTLALAGGTTPALAYRRLAAATAASDWSRWEVFFGDERCVPNDHADSNYRMAREALLDHVPIPTERVHPMVTDPDDPETDATRYEDLIRERVPTEDGMPVLDLVLLGLGTDGHTASLFPGADILRVQDRLVASVYVERLGSYRISLTYPLLNRARHILFLVGGESKAALIAELERGAEPGRYPVQGLSPQGTVEWYLDRAAASALS